MLTTTADLLNQARLGRYSIGAFNVYCLEQAHGVVNAAVTLQSPVILQLLPKALDIQGAALIKLCLEVGRNAAVPVAVHLDHCTSETTIGSALAAGVSSVMADGSHLPYADNIAFTRQIIRKADRYEAGVESELGRLTGTEDGMSVEAYESQLTDPAQAADFVEQTRTDALAVCIGNIHGTYPRPPELDFDRLEQINRRVTIPLVLHGTSGLADDVIRRCIDAGICKFNVNTELREAYLAAAGDYLVQTTGPELVDLIHAVTEAVKDPVQSKIDLFGSVGKAD